MKHQVSESLKLHPTSASNWLPCSTPKKHRHTVIQFHHI